MKNLKKLLFILIGAFSMGSIITSCNDDFSEEDLLKLQVELNDAEAVKALAALNAAGELVSFQIKVVDTNGAGVEALDVTMVAAAEGGVADNQTLVTDASGLVFFDRVAIGGNTISISGTNIMDALLSVDFGDLSENKHYKIINGVIVPTPVTENSIITVISTDVATATVSGNVQIETDVTNTTTEVPQNVTLIADFDDGLVETASVAVNYFFATADVVTIGSATVDNTTGDYTMSVPAGINFNLLIPDVQFTQRIAVNEVNDIVLAQPEYRDIITNFGNSYNTDFNTPDVVGARVVFEAPGTPGDGFTLGSFARVGRSIQNFLLDSGSDPITEPLEDVADIVTQFTSLGSGYSFSPTVTITDASGADATAEARIEYLVNSLTVSTPGTGYANNTDYNVQIHYFDDEDVPVTHNHINLLVTSSATGTITQTEINAGITAANLADNTGFGTNYAEINEGSTSMAVVFPAGGAGDGVGAVSINGRIHVLDMLTFGTNYVSPAFAFTGGGSTSQAVLNVMQFGTQWTLDVDNSGVTTPYPLLPSSIEIEHFEVDDDNRSIAQTSTIENAETFIDGTFTDLLTVDGAGNVQWVDQTATYQTTILAHEAPRAIITRNEANIAQATMDANDIDLIDGSISSIDDISDAGSGYTDRFTITIEPSAVGAPGSGVIVELRDGDFLVTGEYDWDEDFDILNEGSGFLRNLNQVGGDRNFEVNGSTGTTAYENRALDVGETYIINIDYGTGVRSENID